MSLSTTIAVASNGQSLPQAVITVASTTSFPATGGTILVTTGAGVQIVTYGATSGATFTGCSGGTGAMSTGGAVQMSSGDRGLTFAAAVSNELLMAPAAGFLGIPDTSHGNYILPVAVSDGYRGGLDSSSTAFLNASLAASSGNSVPLPHVNIVYYKMVGYYIAGAVYEAFVVTTTPTAESVTNPNTGHALVKTRVAASWIV